MASKTATLIIKLKDKVSGAMGKMRGAADSLKQNFLKLTAAGVGATLMIKDMINFFFEQEKAVKKLDAAVANMSGATGETSKNLQELASQLQAVTTYGDETTIQMMAMLGSMGMNEKEISSLTPLIQDMATAMNMDLVTAGQLVGKVMAGQTGALSRYGIQVEKSADGTVNLASMMKSLAGFQGQAAAIANTTAGKFKQFDNTIGDLKEEIGAVIAQGLAPIVSIFQIIMRVFNSLSPSTKKLIVSIMGIGLAVTALLPILGGMAIAINAISWPVLAVVGALALLGAGIAVIKTNFLGWGEVITGVKDVIVSLFAPLGRLGEIINALINKEWGKAWKLTTKDVSDSTKKLSEDTGKALNNTGAAWDGLKQKIIQAKKDITKPVEIVTPEARAPAGQASATLTPDPDKEEEKWSAYLDTLRTKKEEELAVLQEFDILDQERKLLNDELDMAREESLMEWERMTLEEKQKTLEKALKKEDKAKAQALMKHFDDQKLHYEKSQLAHKIMESAKTKKSQKQEALRTAEAKRNAELRKSILIMEQGTFQNYSNFMMSATRSKNAALRGIAKGMAIRQATMNTYRAATGAYAALASIPFVGPALGAAAAGAAIAWGLEQVRNIASMAQGGVVLPTPGGTIARVGEAGKAEAVIPLDDEEAEEKLGGIGSNVTINVQTGAYMGDETSMRELALIIDEQLFKAKRAGETVSI